MTKQAFCAEAWRQRETHVEGKGSTSIAKQDQNADPVKRIEWLETFCEWEDDEVDDSTDWGIVVEGDDGVHLVCQPRSCVCQHRQM